MTFMRRELSHIQLLSSLVSRPSLAPVFDRLQYAKTGGGRGGKEGLVNLTIWSVAQTSHILTPSYIAKQQ